MTTKWLFTGEITVVHAQDSAKKALANKIATASDPDTHDYADVDWTIVDENTWSMKTPCTAKMDDTATTFHDDGYPALLTDKDITNEEIDTARTFITISVESI